MHSYVHLDADELEALQMCTGRPRGGDSAFSRAVVCFFDLGLFVCFVKLCVGAFLRRFFFPAFKTFNLEENWVKYT